MTTEVASLKVVFTGDDSQLKGTIAGVKSNLQSTGGQLSGVGHQIGTGIMQGMGLGIGLGIAGVTAQIAGLGPAMLSSAADWSNALGNANSILKLTGDELAAVKSQVLGLGAESVAGPQMVAEAYYEIVSAVADTSVHMDLLSASIHTAEAGQADLIGTTKALTSIMNAYKLEADDAANISDVLSQTVAKGVGSMDAFGAAFGQVAGLGATLNVGLDELGAELAFITTRGFSASEAATQLSSAMTAFINPSDKMKKALKEMGYESGSALIKAEGLAGAMEMLSTAMGGNVDSIADLLGRKEALQAFLAITGDGFTEFFGDFESGIEGATEAAREIQLQEPAQQWELFKSKVSALGIALGSEFLPAALDTIDAISMLVDVGAELLGIDLEFDVSGDAPDLEAEANRIIGPIEPIEVEQGVTVTFAQGDIAWDIWERDFKDQMSWEEFSTQYYDALRAAGIPHPTQTPTGFSFEVNLGVETVADTSSVTGLERLNAGLYDTGRATESIEPTRVGELATKLNELFAKQGLTTDFAFAFGLIGPALAEANTQLDNMTLTPGEAITAFNDLKTAINDIAEGTPVLIDTMGAKIAVEFLDMAAAGVSAANEVIKAWNQADITGMAEIAPLDDVLSQIEAERDAIFNEKLTGPATMAVRVELTNPEEVDIQSANDFLGGLLGGLSDMAGSAMELNYTAHITDVDYDNPMVQALLEGDVISFEVDSSSLEVLGTQLTELESAAGEPLNIMVGEDSYTSVADYNAALMSGTYDSVTEPLSVTISQGSMAQVSQFGMDMDWATRNRIPVVTIDSNLPGFAYDLNNTVKDRIMTVTLRLMESMGQVGIPGFAEGGGVSAGEPIIVGEEGPEVYVPPGNGQIIPNSDLVAMSHSGADGSGGGMNINIQQVIVQNPASIEDMYDQIVQQAQSMANPGFAMGDY